MLICGNCNFRNSDGFCQVHDCTVGLRASVCEYYED